LRGCGGPLRFCRFTGRNFVHAVTLTSSGRSCVYQVSCTAFTLRAFHCWLLHTRTVGWTRFPHRSLILHYGLPRYATFLRGGRGLDAVRSIAVHDLRSPGYVLGFRYVTYRWLFRLLHYGYRVPRCRAVYIPYLVTWTFPVTSLLTLPVARLRITRFTQFTRTFHVTTRRVCIYLYTTTRLPRYCRGWFARALRVTHVYDWICRLCAVQLVDALNLVHAVYTTLVPPVTRGSRAVPLGSVLPLPRLRAPIVLFLPDTCQLDSCRYPTHTPARYHVHTTQLQHLLVLHHQFTLIRLVDSFTRGTSCLYRHIYIGRAPRLPPFGLRVGFTVQFTQPEPHTLRPDTPHVHGCRILRSVWLPRLYTADPRFVIRLIHRFIYGLFFAGRCLSWTFWPTVQLVTPLRTVIALVGSWLRVTLLRTIYTRYAVARFTVYCTVIAVTRSTG